MDKNTGMRRDSGAGFRLKLFRDRLIYASIRSCNFEPKVCRRIKPCIIILKYYTKMNHSAKGITK